MRHLEEYERDELGRTLRGARWGLLATVAMSVLMLAGFGRVGRHGQVFPLAIVTHLLGHGGFGVGLLAALAHLAYGALAGVLFAYFCRPMTLLKGIGFGLFLWWAMQITFIPWLGRSDFGLADGHSSEAFSTLVMHLIYGGALGRLGARDEARQHATFDDLGHLQLVH
jgi:hypothetical protein